MSDIYSQIDVDLFERLSKPLQQIPVVCSRFSLREHGFRTIITYSENDVRCHHHALFFQNNKS